MPERFPQFSGHVDIDIYLAALPRRKIAAVSADAPVPKIRSSGQLSDYNGFTGKERLRTFEIAKWLMGAGAMQHSGRCTICGGQADQLHAEDYFDLKTWMDICRSCHSGLHGRFRHADAWERRLASYPLPEYHWARALPAFQIDIAAYYRSHGLAEPTVAVFVAAG